VIRKGSTIFRLNGSIRLNGDDMKYCGMELKGSEALIAIVEKDEAGLHYVESQNKRIALTDDESQAAVKLFQEAIAAFLRTNQISIVAIKKRNKKGEFSSGAVSFKIEGLLQVNPVCEVRLIAAPTIAASHRRNNFPTPPKLNKYQLDAYLTACCCAEAS